ncbi:pyrroline-5-carboxylate reductase [Allopseudospirillum japonicum]|uniref:Pyrroline-5-carboxylate reductase n=1 Tax=Allopseudospirillum japonicum TaxID=64971 RepID=A0A1H6URH4_9GAMM|nr:pyrroline-5-carboxylate reductase [Allopseudospirillum japonicum]SEI90655.1 pyrroline-5-carboxylate reductase [Allopseudospirillum japonicum]
MAQVLQKRLAFIGAGNMANAIIGGLRQQGLAADLIYASNPEASILAELQQTYGIHTQTSNLEVARQAEIWVLAVKPQILRQVCQELSALARQQRPLIISIAAGVTLEMLGDWLGAQDLPLIRCMPNTPALVGAGASGLYANAQVTEEEKASAQALMQAVGISLWVEEEALIDAVTGISGSGPAYFFLAMEALAAAGEAQGLTPEVARQLSLQTALGAARMACENTVDVAELRRRVTSPKGTTERAIQSFEAAGLRQIYQDAVQAAVTRSQELAQELANASK